MKDELDLDQLHREVNNLMDQATKQRAKRSAKQSSSTEKKTVAPATPAASPPQPKLPKDDADSIKVTVKRPLPKLAARRGPRGAAMDIVQPKPTTGITPPSAKPKRTAPAIQPTKSVAPEPVSPVTPTPAPSVPTEEPKQPEASQNQDVSDDVLASINMQEDVAEHPDEPPKKAHETWPDPLEVHGFKDEEDEPAEPKGTLTHATNVEPPTLTTQTSADDTTAQEPAVEESEPVIPEVAEASEVPPATTPFVTTKVEKRPLGAYTGNQPLAPDEEPTQPEEEPAKESVPEPAPQPLPSEQKELSAEVVAVESNEPEFRPEVPPAPKMTKSPEPKAAESEGQTDLHTLSQMAIPPQYKSADKQPSKEERPVFDTKQYHPPIDPAHAAHRTGSKWGWVLIGFLVLLLVAAGVAAYWVITGGTDITRFF